MKKHNTINNLQELKARQASLAADQALLSKELLRKTPGTLLSFPVQNYLKPAQPFEILKIDRKTNIPVKVLSYLLPMLINKTILRQSGFVTKLMVAVVTRKLIRSLLPNNRVVKAIN